MAGKTLKQLTARSVKWSLIDKVSQQVLYGITGVILANLLSKEDFGLIGAILVFQAFAALFVDSGFSYALIQRKRPSKIDYSTVLWFNVSMAVLIYVVLFFCAPFIADCFGGDGRIVPLSRVMFLTFIVNATAIVQTNRLTKMMHMRPVMASNALGLIAGAIVGISLAIEGFGAWALVWQSVALAVVKSGVLWATTGWKPLMRFSFASLRKFFKVGSGMVATSLLNTVFQNIYSFFIGNRAGLLSLGYYTQADKWSKMGITAVSQTVTTAFLPGLSHVQDDAERFTRVSAKMNRFTAYLVLPAMGFLAVCATQIFHCLFATKWDACISLFQLLLLRGVFTVLNTLYNNYLIAKGRTREVVRMEGLRDIASLLFLVAAFPWINYETPADPVAGIRLLLWGQVAASAITWGVMACRTAPLAGRRIVDFIGDNLPYAALTAVAMIVMWREAAIAVNCWLLLGLQLVTGLVIYVGGNWAMGSRIQHELWGYMRTSLRF